MTNIVSSIARGGGIVLGGIIAGKLFHLLLHILLTRQLSLKEYGIYSLAYSFFIICSRISLMGIPTGLVKYCSAYNATNEFSKTKGMIKSGYSIVFTTAVIICVILLYFNKVIVYDFLKEPQLKFCLVAFILFIPIFNLTRTSQAVIRSFKRMLHYSVLKEILFPFLFILLSLFFLTVNNSLSFVIYAFCSALIITFIVNGFVVFKLFSSIKNDGKVIHTPLKLIRFSLPVFLVGVSYLLLNQLSKMMIGYFQVSENVGIFNAAMNIGALLIIFLNCIDVVFAPYISELHTTKKFFQMKLVFRATTRWVFILTVPLFLICLLFSKNIMSIFGHEYIPGSYVLTILAAGYTMNSITGSVAYILQMSGKQDIELFNMIIAVFVNLLMNYFLIPLYGIVGAALATGCSIALLNIIRLLEVYYFFRMQPYDIKYVKPLLAALGATAIICLISGVPLFKNIFWIIKVIIYSLSYVFILVWLKLEQEDVTLISDIIRFRKSLNISV